MFFSGISTSQNSINTQCVEFSPHSALFNFFFIKLLCSDKCRNVKKYLSLLAFHCDFNSRFVFCEGNTLLILNRDWPITGVAVTMEKITARNELCSSHWLPWSIVISVIESFSPHTQSTCFYIYKHLVIKSTVLFLHLYASEKPEELHIL